MKRDFVPKAGPKHPGKSCQGFLEGYENSSRVERSPASLWVEPLQPPTVCLPWAAIAQSSQPWGHRPLPIVVRRLPWTELTCNRAPLPGGGGPTVRGRLRPLGPRVHPLSLKHKGWAHLLSRLGFLCWACPLWWYPLREWPDDQALALSMASWPYLDPAQIPVWHCELWSQPGHIPVCNQVCVCSLFHSVQKQWVSAPIDNLGPTLFWRSLESKGEKDRWPVLMWCCLTELCRKGPAESGFLEEVTFGLGFKQ